VLVHLLSLALAASSPAPAQKLFEFQDPRIVESSGIAASARRDDVFFTHNDSGDTARFFAVDRHGCTLGVFDASGVKATDWEDIARGPGPSLWLGDIGDNGASRPEIVVHRFAEPEVGPATSGGGCPPAPETAVTPESFRLAYEDGPHDAETLLVHPRTGQVFIVTKSFTGPEALYAAPSPLQPDAVNTLRKLADVAPAGDGFFTPTAGDIAPDASVVALRGYGDIYVWPVKNGDVPAAFARGATVEHMPAPDAGKQGEGLAFTRAGDGLVTSTEGANAPVYLIPRVAPAAAPACKRRTAVTLRVRARRGVRATVDGKPAAVTVRAGKARVSLTKAKRASGKAAVRVTGRTRAGRRVADTRRVAVCL